MKTAQCDIVQDLLPLYADGSLSQASVEFVDEHLAECEECKTLLSQMQMETKIEVPDANVSAPVNNIKKRFINIIMGIVAILLPLLIVFLTLFVKYGLPVKRGFAPRGAEALSVSTEAGKVVITPKESDFNNYLYYIYRINDDDTISMFVTYGEARTQYMIAGESGTKYAWTWSPFSLHQEMIQEHSALRVQWSIFGGAFTENGSAAGDNLFSWPTRIVLDGNIREIFYAPEMSTELIAKWNSGLVKNRKALMEKTQKYPYDPSLQGLIPTEGFGFDSLGETVLIWRAE